MYKLVLPQDKGTTVKDLPIVVIVGPSGVGKTSLYRRLLRDFNNIFAISISYTTRPMRPKDKDGVDYYFVDNERFNEMKSREEFLENNTYVGNQYGTAFSEINRIHGLNKIPLFEIELNGYKQVISRGVKTIGIFLTVPDITVLKQRLEHRKSDNEDMVRKRLERARQELEEAEKCHFEIRLVNDDFDQMYETLKAKILDWYPIQVEESI
ncbi:bifunctional Guanylate kinase-like domain/P-loop containing nucleoside triphosphate hydrolase/Guanylate kinase/Guanylate kinase-L-type calcium channel beta subunit/Guanylate kinase [Babesia duncani]|uniref:guanylate kinase n=1 Tax=Babesia duncani TaxID=323732 RepID=A0AAD9UMY1_9APIC|nr:bifunctional Guanylate kinase-like domain/P-loop containing nucleoside triphosphate hydrolase/Guanylate kinase/Guanylate kinase-L-type calcium channel beta subunit/Guanylate kinase [Babesia duncani]